MKLKNDKERREFVYNSDNWEVIGELNSLVRLTRLEYKGREWFGIDIRSEYDTFDPDFNRIVTKRWTQIAIYQLDTETRAFSIPWSRSQVAAQLKQIDKEEKSK